MPFILNYDVEKKPKLIFPDGREEASDEHLDLWHLFYQVEHAKKERSGDDAPADHQLAPKPTTIIADTSIDQLRHRSPQKVIDTLFEARKELEIILDLISDVEQQQFLSLAHLPQPIESSSSTAKSRQTDLRLARRRAQLKQISQRLRDGLHALETLNQASDAFLHDLAELKAQWKVRVDSKTHVTKTLTTTTNHNYYIDISLHHFLRHVHSTKSLSAIETRYNIVPNGQGQACMIVNGITYTGPSHISSILQKLQSLYWRSVVAGIIESEVKHVPTQLSSSVYTHSAEVVGSIVSLLQRMAALAVIHSKQRIREGEDNEDEALYDGMIVHYDPSATFSSRMAQDVASYISDTGHASCQAAFESFSLSCLADLCQYVYTTPRLLSSSTVSTPATNDGKSARDGSTSLLHRLILWMKNNALRHAVEKALERSQDNTGNVLLGGNIRDTMAPATKWNVSTTRRAACWYMMNADGSIRGTLTADPESYSVRWSPLIAPLSDGVNQDRAVDDSGVVVVGRRDLDAFIIDTLKP